MVSDAMKVGIGFAIFLVIAYLWTSGVPGAAPVPPPTEPPEDEIKSLMCGYAPTVQLGANDKYTAGQTNWGNWKYKLNSGTTTTDADGSFEVPSEGVVKLDVLVADGNSSAYYRALWSPELHCGLNPVSYNDVIRFTTYEVMCYNDEGLQTNGSNPTDGRNLTIGQGGSRSIKCELTGVAKRGVPYGAILVLEVNKTDYKEEELSVTWDGSLLGAADKTPGAYSSATTVSTQRSFTVPAFEGPAVHTFFINVQAESDYNPTSHGSPSVTDPGSSIVGTLYPINCFEEEDVTPSIFRCAVEDMDQTWTSPGGTGAAAIAQFLVPVD